MPSDSPRRPPTPPNAPLKRPDWPSHCFIPGACRDIQDGAITGGRKAADLFCNAFCSLADPHERTGDGVRFGFQGAGEFQMVASPDKSVVIQARMEPIFTSTLVTFGAAVAALVAGDRVAVGDDRPAVLARVKARRGAAAAWPTRANG